MRGGFTPTILRRSSNRLSGRVPTHRDQGKRIKCEAQQRWWSSFFFDERGVVHREFLPPGSTVNSDFYCDVLRRLRENVRRRRSVLWRSRSWLLHHDNAPAHTSLKTSQFLSSNGMTVVPLPHPPYSLDFAPCDFTMFPKMKLKLKGRRFKSWEEIQRETEEVLNDFQEENFWAIFEERRKRWDHCIRATGEYFEGDKSSLFANMWSMWLMFWKRN